jgi:hypothetical protein
MMQQVRVRCEDHVGGVVVVGVKEDGGGSEASSQIQRMHEASSKHRRVNQQ